MFKKIILSLGMIACITERCVGQEVVATQPLTSAEYAAALFPEAPKFKVRGIQRTDAAEPKSVARSVNFAYNSAAIPADFQAELLQLVEAMKAPGAEGKVLVITGHTDAVGAPDYNLVLSLKRAAAVETFLVAHGVPGDKLVATGKGMLQPLPDHDGKDSVNRRVEFAVPAK